MFVVRISITLHIYANNKGIKHFYIKLSLLFLLSRVLFFLPIADHSHPTIYIFFSINVLLKNAIHQLFCLPEHTIDVRIGLRNN
jgi:Na+-transporting methylmalonyl-CoA/oxaloacetate decarboxylase beta subunit